MKSLISIPTFLTVIVVAGVIALIPLSPSPLPILTYSDSDDSETNTDQRLKQKNIGSGESTNFNCAENMITSASESIDCIPSGPAPPTPATAFTIVNAALDLTGAIFCGGNTLASRMEIDATGDESGRVTGTVTIDEAINLFPLQITSGTTDGNTFSLSGPEGRCSGGPFTVSGDCGINVGVRYEEDGASGNFGTAAGVICTLL